MGRDDWPRFGSLVRTRRETLRLTQHEAVTRADGGISLATWRNIETATNPPYRRSSLLAVCRVLRWSPDSIEDMLAGGGPIIVTPDDLEGQTPEWWERLERVEALLAELLAERDQRRADDDMPVAERTRLIREHQAERARQIRPPEAEADPGREHREGRAG